MIRILLVALPISAVSPVTLSCSSAAEEEGPPATADAGPDSTPSLDARAPDVAAPDAENPKPLEVVCAVSPCYVAVSGNGGRHVCGLLADGTVRCWGRDTERAAPRSGALGRGVAVSVVEGAAPAPVVGLSEVTQLSVGPNLGTCARRRDGTISCWGKNEFGQLGRSPTEEGIAAPTPALGLPPVDEVHLGARTGCAITSNDRALYCWGEAMQGLGVDTEGAATFLPHVVPMFRPPVKAVAIGTWNNQDTVIVLLDGDVLANVGALPAGARTVETPLERPQEIPGIRRIATFAYVTSEGVARRWRLALDDFGQAGVIRDALYLPSSSQIVEMKVSGSNQGEQGGALLASGRLFRWGINTAGALGVPPNGLTAAIHPLEMTQVGQVVSFATTFGSTCVSLTSGAIQCWGTNAYGELGRGAIDALPHPEAEVIQ